MVILTEVHHNYYLAKIEYCNTFQAFALFANGGVKDIPEAIEKVKAGLDSGNAVKHLKFMAEVSNSF